MFTFVFQPSANRETLREFNERLQEYCAENPVVNIDAHGFGNNLMIQGTTADDVDASNVPTLTATVRTLNPSDPDLEEQLDGLIAQEQEKHNPDPEKGDPNLPIKFVFIRGDKHSWAVILCVNGVAEDEDEGGDNGDGKSEISPSQGFGG